MFVTNIKYITVKRKYEHLTVEDEGFEIERIDTFASDPPKYNGIVNILFTISPIDINMYENPTLCFVKYSLTTENTYRFEGMAAKYITEETNTYNFQISSPIIFNNTKKTRVKLLFISNFTSLDGITDPSVFLEYDENQQILEMDIPNNCYFEGGLLLNA